MSDSSEREQIAIIKEGTKRVTADKETALAFLKRAGILTASGKLSKAFGG
jgi:hypothetical protein